MKGIVQSSMLPRVVRSAVSVTALVAAVSPLFAQDRPGPQGASSANDNVHVSVFMGSSIDSFAAEDLKKYINPQESGDFREQLVAGFDFEYVMASKGAHSFVLYGETVHGARSGEVDCSQEGNAQKDACKIARLELASSSAPLAIFRKATSLEAFVGLRAELFQLGAERAHSNFYVKGQLGFLSAAGKGGDLIDIHHVGVGLILSETPMRESYFEIGYGRNDLFEKKYRRTKIDGFLTFSRNDNAHIKPFFQFTVDSDFGGGSDNIQTYFGLDIDVLEFFK